MKGKTEITVGLFMALGIACLTYLSVKLGEITLPGISHTYSVTADFANVGGLKPGAQVVISGVPIGTVENIQLQDYRARVRMTVAADVRLYEDAIAAVKTRGLIGEKYVDISPGGGVDKTIPSDGKIRETQSAVDLEELISKFVFEEI